MSDFLGLDCQVKIGIQLIASPVSNPDLLNYHLLPKAGYKAAIRATLWRQNKAGAAGIPSAGVRCRWYLATSSPAHVHGETR